MESAADEWEIGYNFVVIVQQSRSKEHGQSM